MISQEDLESAWPTLEALGIPLWHIAADGRLLRVNAISAATMPDPDATAGVRLEDLIAEGDREAVRVAFTNLISGTTAHETIRCSLSPSLDDRHVVADGTLVVDDLGRPHSVVAVSTDIDEEHQDAVRWARIVEHTGDIITLVGADGTVLFQSRSIEEVLGQAADRGVNYLRYVEPEDIARAVEAFGTVTAEPGSSVRFEMRARHADGSVRVLEANAVNRLDEPAIGGIVVTTRDVTDRSEAEERLRWVATHDMITDLPNWRWMRQAVDGWLGDERRDPGNVGLILASIDHWSLLIASLGQSAADDVLRDMARRIRSGIHEEAVFAHLGRESFLVLIDGGGPHGENAERLLAHLDTPMVMGGRNVHLGMSLGVATAQEGDDAETLLQRAESAAATARSRGGSQVAVADRAAHSRAAHRLDLEEALRLSIEAGDIEVHYQPQYDAERRTLHGFEALARWTHPFLGPISPAEFVPIAEQSELIVLLGEQVLRQACAAHADLLHLLDETPSISVNVSPRQFRDLGFVDSVLNALLSAGLPAPLLTLEITESALMDDPATASQSLAALRGLGVKVSVDDFGTGHSSLAQLKRFPVDYLKIDREFIEGVGRDPQDTELVRAMLAMAESLDLEVVAEGVEHLEQVEHLAAMGCCITQGFLWSAPVSMARLISTIARVENLGHTIGRRLAEQGSVRAAGPTPLQEFDHEVRNLLTIIEGASTHIRFVEGDERSERSVAAVRRATSQLSGVLGDFVAADGAARWHRPQEEVIDLGAVAQELCDEVSSVLPDIRIVVHRPLGGPSVVGDRHGLRRALLNLLTHAGRHAPPKSAVDVGVTLDTLGAEAVVTVTDHGAPIPDAERHQVFTPAFTPSTRPGGRGIGLSVAREVALSHGGDLTHTTPAGGGSAFTLRLPARMLAADRSVTALEEHTSAVHADDAGARQDVVDLAEMSRTLGEVVVLICRRDRQEAAVAHPDLSAAIDLGQVTLVDSEDLLAKVCVDGVIDPMAFHSATAPLLNTVARSGRRVRVYSDMVDLLLDAGSVDQAEALERVWSGVCERHGLALVCGFRPRSRNTPAPEVIARAHSHTRESSPPWAGPDVEPAADP